MIYLNEEEYYTVFIGWWNYRLGDVTVEVKQYHSRSLYDTVKEAEAYIKEERKNRKHCEGIIVDVDVREEKMSRMIRNKLGRENMKKAEDIFAEKKREKEKQTEARKRLKKT